MRRQSDGVESLRPLFSAGVVEWGVLLLSGALLWGAVAVLGRFTSAFATRDATYYPVLACLLAPASFVAGARTSGRWGAVVVAALTFMALFRGSAGLAPPLVALPALAVDCWYAYRGNTRGVGGAVMAGFLFAWVFYSAEAGWTFWLYGEGWPRNEILGGLVFTLLTGMASAVLGYLLGGRLRRLIR